MTSLYPLRFREVLRNYSFGGRWIVEAYEKENLPEDHRVAETWEVCDRPNESSAVLDGALAGKTLHELIDLYGVELLGRDIAARCGMRFPLLLKFLDATHVLGEQAHQNDALAAEEGRDDPGKTEAWYMLKVRPGATVHCGNRPGVTWEDIHTALLQGTIKDLMQEYSVAPGDAFLLYAGAMHYAKGGVLFFEIMQNSDVVIGLKPRLDGLIPAEREAKAQALMRGIHLEEGFEPKTRPLTIADDGNRHTFIFACRYFALERLDLLHPYRVDCNGERFFVVSQIEGSSTIVWGEQRVPMRAGFSCLLPANLGSVTIEPGKDCALLVSYVPDLAANIIAPLRAAGFTDTDITWLGGRTRLNDIVSYL